MLSGAQLQGGKKNQLSSTYRSLPHCQPSEKVYREAKGNIWGCCDSEITITAAQTREDSLSVLRLEAWKKTPVTCSYCSSQRNPPASVLSLPFFGDHVREFNMVSDYTLGYTMYSILMLGELGNWCQHLHYSKTHLLCLICPLFSQSEWVERICVRSGCGPPLR